MGNAGSRGDGDSPAGGWRFRPRSTLPGMDNIQDQIRVLQTSVRRQRFAIVALASILAGSALIGAARPAGDATFDTITCKEWSVVDKSGKERISASTDAKGTAAVVWSDKDGKTRIGAATFADGATSVELALGDCDEAAIRQFAQRFDFAVVRPGVDVLGVRNSAEARREAVPRQVVTPDPHKAFKAHGHRSILEAG